MNYEDYADYDAYNADIDANYAVDMPKKYTVEFANHPQWVPDDGFPISGDHLTRYGAK